MARPLRIEYADAFYHITSRGNEQKDIFKTQRDRERFLGYLESATERYGAVLHVYCLMSNHYHLLLQTPRGNLSQIMRHINGAYTTYYNKKRERSGHLLQGRYRAILVDKDTYAQELSRYIHLNPVRAGMVDRPEQYAWSSYRYYIHEAGKPAWLCTEFILSYAGKGKAEAQKEYRGFVEAMVGRRQESPLLQVIGSTILGGTDYVERIKEKYVRGRRADRHVPAIQGLADRPGIEQIAELVARECRDDAAESRKITLYLCRRHTGRRLKEIGQRFSVSESGVSQAGRRVARQLQEEPQLRKKVEVIQQKLGLSKV